MHTAAMGALGMLGNTLASAMRRPRTPFTRSSESTTVCDERASVLLDGAFVPMLPPPPATAAAADPPADEEEEEEVVVEGSPSGPTAMAHVPQA